MGVDTYYILPERRTRALMILKHVISDMTADDIAGVLIEIGLGECITYMEGTQVQFRMSNVQMIAAAAALTAVREGLPEEPIILGGDLPEAEQTTRPKPVAEGITF